MSRPASMSSRHWDKIRRLPAVIRDEVLERAAIKITHAGLSPEQADAEAIAEVVRGWSPELPFGLEDT